ncbi:Exocyst complex component 5 [Malassezia sp. CBS 17886]|nr:Exocyst complex component 5 [Malassezia sp. CBS 17886]
MPPVEAGATRAPPTVPARGRNRPVPSAPGGAEPEQALLTSVRAFQGPFDCEEFVATLSEKHLSAARSQPVFDATPFRTTFAKTLSALQKERAAVTEQCTAVNSAVQVSQSVYTKKLRQLTNNFDATQTSFDALHSRISEVGRTAIRIGEELEALDQQRARANEAYDLIQYYYMFARGDTTRLDKLRKEGGRDGRLKAAMIARRLAVISREVDIQGSAATREAIDRYCEQFERDMLKLFDKYYRRSDPKMMSHVAQVLQSFNGGASCIQIYVNQHDCFISKDRVVGAQQIRSSPVWATISDPNALPPRSEPSLDALFTDIRRTVELEAQIIAAVFPSPLLVMQTFLQRMFAQTVQTFVEAIMEHAHAVDLDMAAAPQPQRADASADTSGLAFLRMLHVTRSAAMDLVGDLKTIDLRSAGITGSAHSPYTITSGLDGIFSMDADTLARGGETAVTLLGREPFSTAQLAAAGGNALGAMLDQAVEELFFPYLDSVKYIDRECRMLSALYACALHPFFTWHRNTVKASRTNATIFSRVRDQFTGGGSAASFGSSVAFTALSDGAGQALGADGATPALKDLVGPARGADGAETPGQRGELALDLAERMLRWHAEALGRCVDLGAASDVPKNTSTLLHILTHAYIKAYVEAALETATMQMFAYDVRAAVPPDMDVMRIVQQVEQLIALWQHYVQTAVLPLTAPSVTIRREALIYNNHNMLRVEGKCEALLQKYTDNMLAFLAARLATQKKSDYNPKNDDVMFARLNTDPCLAIVDVLTQLDARTRAHLAERTRESLTTEVGIGFHALLLEHLKKFTVSATGGLMLTKDLAMYQDVCCRFGIPIVADRFEMLRQLGNLFIVQPSVLKSYMREGHLAKIDEALLRPYLLRRQDYSRDIRGLQNDEAAASPAAGSGGASSSLFASLSQHGVLGGSWSHSDAADTKAIARDADPAAFLTDLHNESEWLDLLRRRASVQLSDGATGGDSVPDSRAGTPQQGAHLSVSGASRTSSPKADDPRRTDSPGSTTPRLAGSPGSAAPRLAGSPGSTTPRRDRIMQMSQRSGSL